MAFCYAGMYYSNCLNSRDNYLLLILFPYILTFSEAIVVLYVLHRRRFSYIVIKAVY